ncbi:MAG: hypothetical protein GXO10_03505 [Crenarchaeota archaeon]|nr:hypothetical protein [Thermoproteota archaeon]
MSTIEEFIRSEIEGKVLRLVREIEELYEEIIEDWSTRLSVSRPNIIVTLQDVDECSEGTSCIRDVDPYCKSITGQYLPDSQLIVLNYRSTLDVLLHLFLHHVYAQQIGFDRYRQVRTLENIRLPWSLRPTEIRILNMAKRLYNVLVNQRAGKTWTDYIKVRIRELDELIQKIANTVHNYALSTMPNLQMRQIAYKVQSRRNRRSDE